MELTLLRSIVIPPIGYFDIRQYFMPTSLEPYCIWSEYFLRNCEGVARKYGGRQEGIVPVDVSGSFIRTVGLQDGKSIINLEKDLPQVEVGLYQYSGYSPAWEIKEEVGDSRALVSLAHIQYLMAEQPNGEVGFLVTDNSQNLFIVMEPHGTYNGAPYFIPSFLTVYFGRSGKIWRADHAIVHLNNFILLYL